MEPRLTFPHLNREAADQEARIRSALGLARGPLPAVDRRWLGAYYNHLAARLRLPFEARYAIENGPARGTIIATNVLTLVNPDGHTADEYTGLVCRATTDGQQIELPLVDLEIDDDHPNYQLLEDYWYWVWNWRFDPQI